MLMKKVSLKSKFVHLRDEWNVFCYVWLGSYYLKITPKVLCIIIHSQINYYLFWSLYSNASKHHYALKDKFCFWYQFLLSGLMLIMNMLLPLS